MFDAPDYDALDAARQLDRFGITLPTTATHWVDRLTHLQHNRPQPENHNRVAELIADNAPESAIAAATAAWLGAGHRQQQHTEAERICGLRALAAVLADRDRIHAELAATADTLIDRLHAAALIFEDIRELTRQRRTDEAHLLATADADAAELTELYRIRDQYLTPRTERWSTGWWDCQHWSNPWDISNRHADHDGTLWGIWRANIRAGGRLWFAPIEHARAASQAHEPADLLAPIDPRRGVFA